MHVTWRHVTRRHIDHLCTRTYPKCTSWPPAISICSVCRTRKSAGPENFPRTNASCFPIRTEATSMHEVNVLEALPRVHVHLLWPCSAFYTGTLEPKYLIYIYTWTPPRFSGLWRRHAWLPSSAGHRPADR